MTLFLPSCRGRGSKPVAGGSQPRLLARVSGIEVKEDALDNRQELETLADKLFQSRLAAVGRAVEEKLLQEEAKKKGKTAEELLGDMRKGIAEPSEEELSEALADPANKWRLESSLKGARSEDEKKEKKEREARFKEGLRAALETRKFTEAREGLLESLWKNAKVELFVSDLVPRRVEVPADGVAAAGGSRAPVVLVAFIDFQAPSCKKAESLLDAMTRAYGERVRVAYRHHPSPMRPLGRRAAEAAACAAAQGKFAAYKDLLFSKPALAPEDIDLFAGSASLEKSTFDKCLSGGEGGKQVDEDLALGKKLGVRNVPSFFVNGIPILTMPSPLELRVLVEAELRRADGR